MRTTAKCVSEKLSGISEGEKKLKKTKSKRGEKRTKWFVFYLREALRYPSHCVQLVTNTVKEVKSVMMRRCWGKPSPHTHALWGGQKPPRRSRPVSRAEGWACCYSDGVFLPPFPCLTRPPFFEFSHSYTNRAAFYTITNTNITKLGNKVESSCSSSHQVSLWGAKSLRLGRRRLRLSRRSFRLYKEDG